MSNEWNLTRLRVQSLSNPLGLETTKPLFSYLIESDKRNQKQTAFQIIAASSKKKLEQNHGDIWDSGKTIFSSTSNILYKGIELTSRQGVYWKVRAWDADDEESSWSDTAYFEMGLLNPEDWKGYWIGQGDLFDGNRSSVPLLAKDFAIQQNKQIERARLYISGLGIFEAHLNGMRITENYYDPGESDCRKTVNYVTYDVTDMVKAGDNALGILLGNGMYGAYDGVGMYDSNGIKRYYKQDGIKKAPNWEGLYGRIKTIAQLEVIYDDGTSNIIITDDSWSYKNGPITFSGWFGGEDYDARLEVKGWDMAGFSRKGWERAEIMTAPAGKLTSRECPPIVVFETYDAVSVTRIKDRNYLVDMGRNGAGIPELIVSNTTSNMAGGRIEMYPAEVIFKDNTVNQFSVTGEFDFGKIFDTYTFNGEGNENWKPKFTYHGYRYLELRLSEELSDWEPKPENFKNHLLRTDNEVIGTFNTSSEDINMVNTIITRSIESNMYSTLTDCPHIEKSGWLDCVHLLFESISSTFDIQAWMNKIVGDILDEQYETGEVAAIAPEFQCINFLRRDPNWGGAIVFTPWIIYQEYGDLSIIKRAYDYMKRYVSFLKKQTEYSGLLLNYAQMGEWGGYDKTTSKDFTACASYYRMIVIISKMAEILDEKEDKKYYDNLGKKVKYQFNKTFFNEETGVYDSGSQASYAIALFSDLVEEKNIPQAVENLVNAIKDRDYHLSTGEVALKQMFVALTRYDCDDVVYKMITNKTLPSYLYFVSHNQTTLPEYWDMSRSLNHCMMGHGKEWLERSLIGIKPTAPGYEKITIKPFIPKDLYEAKGTILSSYGLVASYWKTPEDKKTVTLEVTIPVGVEAIIYLPKLEANYVQLDNRKLNACTDQTGNYFVISNIGSGNYRFITLQ